MVERPTYTPPGQVQFPVAARDFSLTGNFQCQTPLRCPYSPYVQSHALTLFCAHIKDPKHWQPFLMCGHTKILHALLGMGSATLVAAVALGPSHTGSNSRYGNKYRHQATVQAERQIHTTNLCIRTQATHAAVPCVPFHLGKVSRCEGKLSTFLHPASLPMKKMIILCCFAAGVDIAMLEMKKRPMKEEGFGFKI